MKNIKFLFFIFMVFLCFYVLDVPIVEECSISDQCRLITDCSGVLLEWTVVEGAGVVSGWSSLPLDVWMFDM